MAKFKFNLLPKKSNEEILKEKKRDSYLVYYSFLVLFGVVMWFGLTLFNRFIVDERIADIKQSNQDKKNKIETQYTKVRKLHGELVIKTNSLEALLDKDIDPEVVFLVADQVFSNDADVKIVGYERNSDGSFTLSVRANTQRLISEKARSFKEITSISDLSIDSVIYVQTDGEYSADITFNVNKDLF